MRVLTRAGHAVDWAESGDAGLTAVRTGAGNYDVVLLDQLMPGLSGMDTLAGMKAIAPNLPVIIITGSVTDETSGVVLEQGACGCLPKPFNPEQLRDAIKKALLATA